MTDKVKHFIESVSGDEALQAQLAACLEGVEKADLLPALIDFAAQQGYTFAKEDFVADGDDIDLAGPDSVVGGGGGGGAVCTVCVPFTDQAVSTAKKGRLPGSLLLLYGRRRRYQQALMNITETAYLTHFPRRISRLPVFILRTFFQRARS